MLNGKFKVCAIASAILLAAPVFAKSAEKDIISAPQPFTISSINNVYITAGITPQLNPDSLAAPAGFTGNGVLTMSIQNNSVFKIKVSCTGNIVPQICSGGDVISCTNSWLVDAAQDITPFTNDSAYNAGGQTQSALNAGDIVTVTKQLSFNTTTLQTPVENIWDLKLGSASTSGSGAMAPLVCTVSAVSNDKYIADHISDITIPVMVPLA